MSSSSQGSQRLPTGNPTRRPTDDGRHAVATLPLAALHSAIDPVVGAVGGRSAIVAGRIVWPRGGGYPGRYGTGYAVEFSSDLMIWHEVPAQGVDDGEAGFGYDLTYAGPGGFVRLRVSGP